LPKTATIEQLQQRIALYEDMKAYKELYYQLFDGLHRFSYSMVRSKEVAEEIVSDGHKSLNEEKENLQKALGLKISLRRIPSLLII